MSDKLLKTRFEAERVAGFGKAIIALEGQPITHQYNDWCREIAQGIADAENVNLSVEEVQLTEKAVEIDDQGMLVNEPISTRLLSYQLNERWETDEQIKSKTMDVSFLSFLLYLTYLSFN